MGLGGLFAHISRAFGSHPEAHTSAVGRMRAMFVALRRLPNGPNARLVGCVDIAAGVFHSKTYVAWAGFVELYDTGILIFFDQESSVLDV